MTDVLNLEKSILRIHVINHVFNYLKSVIHSFTITNFSFIIRASQDYEIIKKVPVTNQKGILQNFPEFILANDNPAIRYNFCFCESPKQICKN